MEYRKINIWLGWIIFIIATITYLSTIEPTTSFWDCGEFIATAYKLEVGHPPGAPLFMIVARAFSAVAETFFGREYVAMSVNILSALCSSFTILFLFWTITAFAKKLALKGTDGTLASDKVIAILGSGAVGALAYTFSDSFWFSAVEGEVYAMSSFFTAIVFWAIMKWDSAPKEQNNYRWIILIAYLMGLSIGVHLLNLLAIPAMAYVVYFKNNKDFTWKGFIITGLISMVILGIIQAGIIPGSVKMLAGFEMFFVNDLGMGFNSGVFIFLTLLGLLLASIIMFSRNPTGIYRYIPLGLLALLIIPIISTDFFGGSRFAYMLVLIGVGVALFLIKKKSPVLHMSTLAVVVMLIGYSSFTMITIRSLANPPMDENNPENVFSMLSYLNREQYGDRPLFKGHYWMAPPKRDRQGVIIREDGNPVYMRSFTIKSSGKTMGTYNNLFDAQNHLNNNNNNKGKNLEMVEEYIISDDRKQTKIVYDEKFVGLFPRMYSPQKRHVDEYIRWSGFKPIYDSNKQITNRPSFGENLTYMGAFQFNWLYWRYFMWNFSGRQNDTQGHGNILDGNWISGINMVDEQRLGSQDNLPKSFTDNKGYNKFYMIPLLIGLIGFFYQMQKDLKNWWVIALLFFFTGIAIMIYLNSYPYQPRERDYAFVGSFYAFAFWIGLGVYGLFDAARNLSQDGLMKIMGASVGTGILFFLFETSARSGDHTISYSLLFLSIAGVLLHILMKYVFGNMNAKAAAMAAIAIGMVAPTLMAFDGWDDHSRAKRRTGLDFAINYLQSCDKDAIIFTNGDNDTFPLWYAQEVEGIRTDIRVVNLSLLNTDWYIDQCKRKAYESDPVPFSMTEPEYRQGTRDAVYINRESKDTIDVRDAIADIRKSGKLRTPYGPLRVLKSNKLRLPIDKDRLIAEGVVKEEDRDKIVDEIVWKVPGNILNKNNLMMLDLIANFDWKRPIYYAVTTGPDSYINLDPYFELTGLAYKLTPFKHSKNKNQMILGGIDSETMYDHVMNDFRWGNMDKEIIYMDENNRRMTNNLRIQMSNLAEQLIAESKNDKAKIILDKTMEVMPPKNVPLNRFVIPIITSYAEIGDNEKAIELAGELLKVTEDKMDYFSSLDPKFAYKVSSELEINYFIASTLEMMATSGDLEGVSDDFMARIKKVKTQFALTQKDIENYMRNANSRKKTKGKKF